MRPLNLCSCLVAVCSLSSQLKLLTVITDRFSHYINLMHSVSSSQLLPYAFSIMNDQMPYTLPVSSSTVIIATGTAGCILANEGINAFYIFQFAVRRIFYNCVGLYDYSLLYLCPTCLGSLVNIVNRNFTFIIF